MKIKQNIISFLLGMAIMLPIGGYAASEIIAKAVNVPVIVDGALIDTEVYNINGSNCTPARAVAEAMGGTVEWVDGMVQIETPKTDLETVVKNCKDSCVMIYVYKGGKAVMQGSGFVYNGYIVTAKHVTDAGTSYIVYTDDSAYGVPASLVSIETDLDVAVLSANINLPSVALGDSDRLAEGQKLVSITSPGGVQNAIDECTYSGTVYDSNGNYAGVADTFMTGGSSGGAVFTKQSELVGMACRGVDGFNNTIPINSIKPILEKLK